ncbi:hypothetical protein [Muribaculum intestinale]|uniref:hypothetical protein n=1 Tax=Muribaculum intestinale TaxID=1796646 RepID=UPI00272A3C73|nr:hypothetical protein [Muribaculum intestinale]
MKKKYRRAVYFTLISVICLIFSPILLIGAMGVIAGYVCEKWLTPIVEWLKTKLRIYDYDND